MTQSSINQLKKTALFITTLGLLCTITPNIIAHEGGHARASINLSPLSKLRIGDYDQGAAEIVVYDVSTQRAYITNAQASSIDVISISKPESPNKIFSIDLKPYGSVNSVAVNNGIVAVALSAPIKQDNGHVALFDLDGKHLNTLEVGALPDMLTFTPNGSAILVANEGEPNDEYTLDPEGSVSIIHLKEQQDIKTLTQADIKTANFNAFNDAQLDPSIRIFGKNANVSQDLEPEYITVSDDSTTAWVSLQENNALAVLDIQTATVTKLIGLGFKSYNNRQNAIDASDKDNKINIQAWPVFGMYQPDSIASYSVNGQHYIVTANEGDARDYDGFSEEVRLKDIELEEPLLKGYPNIQKDENLGRLKISTVDSDINENGKLDRIYSYGARSFSIWATDGSQTFDSGSDFATRIASRYPTLFNKNDKRSDDKGAEPEALTLGKIGDQTYAFIGLERTSGVMAYNISNPQRPYYADYITTISPKLANDDPNQGDIAPESLVFVSAEDSPNKKPLLLSANEVSATFSIYSIKEVKK